MVTKECAKGIADFVDAVSASLTPEDIKTLGDKLVVESCEGEFKKIFFNENLRHFTPGVQETIDFIADTNPDAIRENSYIEFSDNLITIADAKIAPGVEPTTGSPINASRIVHAAITSTADDPLHPTCGRMDTDVDKLSQLLKMKESTTKQQCATIISEIAK